ncbi:MAG: methyltransferase domain-containing protein [Candidatus Kryptoniota bacterium]
MNYCTDYIDHYRIDAEEFDYFNNPSATERAYEKLFRKFISKLAGKQKNIVDIGSGGGWTFQIPHEQMFFVDLSAKNLDALKSASSVPILADAHCLPFKTGSLDFVIASEILEHLNHPEDAAAEIHRVLKRGGKSIISTPYKEKIRYALCIHCNRVTPMNAHLRSFDRKSLLSLFPSEKKNSYLFGSNILAILRVAKLFNKLPLWIWRLIDNPLIKLTDKAQHIVVVLEK